jgi:glucuronate isomerase
VSRFIHEDFLLHNDEGVRLYHEYAERLPVIDFHTHLSPAAVAQDRTWENLTRIWLEEDHYKWRQMRANGVAERYCTGDAPDRDKFDQFAETMPHLLRNPLYHWCHLELARYFRIDDVLLSPQTAEEIWQRTRVVLESELSARSLLQASRVQVLCTTDDPVDSLEFHAAVASDPSLPVRMLPTWRPDRVLVTSSADAFNNYLDRLARLADVDLSRYTDLVAALRDRHDFFHANGCRLSDRGLSTFCFSPAGANAIETIFGKLRSGRTVAAEEAEQIRTALLLDLARMDAEKGWTTQMHIGALRNPNAVQYARLGPDTGFDAMGELSHAEPLSRYLDTLNSEGALPRTIVYNVHPRDTELLVSLLGSFEDGLTVGKMQLGSAWWFLDHIDGIERHLEAVSQIGSLRRFVGMVTDSRSFLSFSRHEYFRRILCNLLGRDMAGGLLPRDFGLVGCLVEDVCHRNAARYLGFDLPAAIEAVSPGDASP